MPTRACSAPTSAPAERLAQTIVQVAGRAGRADRPGEVLIQSEYPEHPLLHTPAERRATRASPPAHWPSARAAHWPPFSRLALLRASDTSPEGASQFLEQVRDLAQPPAGRGAARPGARGDDAPRRPPPRAAAGGIGAARRCCSGFWRHGCRRSRQLPARRSLRWALDVDPLEVF